MNNLGLVGLIQEVKNTCATTRDSFNPRHCNILKGLFQCGASFGVVRSVGLVPHHPEQTHLISGATQSPRSVCRMMASSGREVGIFGEIILIYKHISVHNLKWEAQVCQLAPFEMEL